MAREPTFEWDDAKDHANRLKHGVSFAQARRPSSIRAASSPRIWTIAALSRATSASAWLGLA
jgi:uncharacterized DUF497 family protein